MVAMHKYLLLVAFSTMQEVARGFPSFRSKLPNGGRVPCPNGTVGCKDGVCQGLGHSNCAGGSLPLNKFGQDMKKNDYEWSKQLCEADSDGDGFTNGEELGDPCCRWAAWGTPSDYTAGFNATHPGDANNKQQSYQRPACERTDPKVLAPVMGKFNPGEIQRSVSVTIDNFSIPVPGTLGSRTTYVDIAWNFPDDTEDEFHAVFAEAIIDTPPGVLHHFVVTGCPEKWPSEMHGKPVNNRTTRASCQAMFGGWAPGRNILEMPSWAGQPIGKKAGIRSFMVNVHFDNAALKEGIVSRDGMKVYYTPTLRPEVMSTISVLKTSQSATVFIPPRKQRYFMTRECTLDIKDATSKQPVEAHVVYAGFHAHLLGGEMVSERIRGNERLSIAVQSPWYFDDQSSTNVYVQNITLKTGDKIQSTCIFNSQGRDKLTVIGLETTDEMCWSNLQLRPGGLEARCRGQIWTGELSAQESLLGLQSRHPVTTADGVWTSSSSGQTGSVISSNLKQACTDSQLLLAGGSNRCPRALRMTGASSGDCDKTVTDMGIGNMLPAEMLEGIANLTILQLCCTDACTTVCPQHGSCPGATTSASPTSTTTNMELGATDSSHSNHVKLAGVAAYVCLWLVIALAL